MQVVQSWLVRGELPWFWVCLNLLPARIAAVFCERVGGSRTGREPGRRSRRPAGVLDAAARGADHARRAGQGGRGGRWGCLPVGRLPFCPGVTSRGGRGGEEGGQPALPGSAGRRPAPR